MLPNFNSDNISKLPLDKRRFMVKGNIQLGQESLPGRMRRFKEFYDLNTQFFLDEKITNERIGKIVRENFSDLGPEKVDEFEKIMKRNNLKNKNEILNDSFYYLVVSFFEKELNLLSNLIRGGIQCKISLNDLGDRGVYRSYKYLEKLCEVNVKVVNLKFPDTFSHIEIRNCLIHGGEVDNLNEKTFRFAKYMDICKSRKDLITLNKKYCLTSLKYFEDVFSLILSESLIAVEKYFEKSTV